MPLKPMPTIRPLSAERRTPSPQPEPAQVPDETGPAEVGGAQEAAADSRASDAPR